MRVLAIRFALDSKVMQDYYEALGFSLNAEGSSPGWTQMDASAGVLALHGMSKDEILHVPPLKCCFIADEKLEDIQERLRVSGFDAGYIRAEDFGRSLQLTDPEGFDIQIDEQ